MNIKKFNFDIPNTQYKEFKLLKVTPIHELQCTLHELIHEPSGARVMHIKNSDPENLFCLAFQTLPKNSSGVAHILEHTVLCGSKKYPIKDPFFAMTRRSLNTFMNALTGADFTCYPAATQNPQDFYNLLEVYLDAVFHPNLKELSFLQEGCRLEFAIPSDPNSPLEYKGIVFNEMKGALGSGVARLAEAMNQALFPDTTYGCNSGGDPAVIPHLSYKELKDFHSTYYHPSRCLFFFYGDLPLERHLDFILEHALKGIEKASSLPSIPYQKRFQSPRRMEIPYPISQEEEVNDRALIAFGWLTCPLIEQEELLALGILEIILMDTDASPLKRALMNSGLVKQASSYMESDYHEVPFVIVARGTNPESAESLEKLIKDSLEEIIKNGIEEEAIENALHRVEFFRSEISGDQAPFGLVLFMRSALLRLHGASPENGLMIHSLFDTLRAEFKKNPHYFTDLIQKHFLDNPHFVRITMVPDKELAAKELADEKSKLAQIRAEMTNENVASIIQKAEELAAFQKLQEEEDIEVLPKIELKDVDPNIREFALTIERIGRLDVHYHECFTNEIVYIDLAFDLPEIQEADLPMVRLYGILLTQMGAAGRSYIENLDYIQAHIGGISASLALNIQASDFNVYKPSIQIRGKALYRKADKLLKLIHDFVTQADFSDKTRLKEVILKHYTGLRSSINQGALKYAVNLSGSRINQPGMIINSWYGLDYFYAIKDIATNWDNKADALINTLNRLNETLFRNDEHPDLVVTCSRGMFEQLKIKRFYGLENLPTSKGKPWVNHFQIPKVVPQGRIISSPIAFIGIVFPTVSYTHPDAAGLNIASFLFDNVVLHQRIREQGGAYGGGSVCNTVSGIFYFYSYRDPNIVTTLKAFEDAIEEIAQGNFDENDLKEAKLEMIQSMDTPVSPGSRGDLAYGWIREGKTPELRQKFRQKVLSLTKDQIIDAVKKHVQNKLETGAIVVFSGKELLEKENIALLRSGKEPLTVEQI